MSLKRSNSLSKPPIDAVISQPAKKTKKGTTVVLHDDAWRRIVPYVDSETLTALACAGKATRDTAVFRDVADGLFSLFLTTECHIVEFAKKDGYNAIFQDLFASPTRSEVCLHLQWEGGVRTARRHPAR